MVIFKIFITLWTTFYGKNILCHGTFNNWLKNQDLSCMMSPSRLRSPEAPVAPWKMNQPEGRHQGMTIAEHQVSTPHTLVYSFKSFQELDIVNFLDRMLSIET